MQPPSLPCVSPSAGPPPWADAAVEFAGMPDFDQVVLPQVSRLRFFRLVPDEEVDASYAAYQIGDIDRLIAAWRALAQPTRAEITGFAALIYQSVGTLPGPLRRLAVLSTLRAVLAAGVRFRSGLRSDVQACLAREFPWLEHRHLHIPPGFTPHFDFPEAFSRFLQSGTLDDARVRWQICAALNEVQQCVYSAEMAERCRLPELMRQSEREAELARNYFAHASPNVGRELWRQCIVVLDALNAAVLAMTCSLRGPLIVARSAWACIPRRDRGQWARFVTGLAEPQALLSPASSDGR